LYSTYGKEWASKVVLAFVDTIHLAHSMGVVVIYSMADISSCSSIYPTEYFMLPVLATIGFFPILRFGSLLYLFVYQPKIARRL